MIGPDRFANVRIATGFDQLPYPDQFLLDIAEHLRFVESRDRKHVACGQYRSEMRMVAGASADATE